MCSNICKSFYMISTGERDVEIVLYCGYGKVNLDQTGFILFV